MNFEIPKNLSQAIELQKELAKKVVLKDIFRKITYVGGIDVHYKDEKIILGYVDLLYTSGEVVNKKIKVFKRKFDFRYIPEFLCFCEGPYIIDFFNTLEWKPDILVLDGHGIAHPRRFGLASYVGVILDIPTIGCAKKTSLW